jgi:hypothetical protein
VGVFRPAARVTDPSGRAWEIYATRLQLPDRREPDPGFTDPGVPATPAAASVAVVDGIVWLFLLVPRVLFRLAVDLPVAAVRASRSDTWTVEAIAWMPSKTTYTWRTTSEYRGHVLAQVEGQLARGEVPRPRHAQFLGVR